MMGAMKKPFLKMHGLGNDFAVFDARKNPFAPTEAQIRALGDRRRGVGFDQMIVICPAASPGTDAFMKIYNADGSEVSACGNATRCVGDVLMRELGRNEAVIETKAGRLHCRRLGSQVSVDMGPARLEWNQIPLARAEDTLSLPLAEGVLKNPAAVSMGNPHAVFFVDDAGAVPLETLGPKVEHHALFPERTNVEAAQVLSRGKIRMRVWERGAGITEACGTGACAVAVAAVRRGLADRQVEVVLDGGSLNIEWRADDGHVIMTGDAALAYRGEVEI
jgi:diaminopimelate epimerase